MTVASDTSGQVSAGSRRICTPPPGRSPQWWSMPGFRGRTATSPMNSAISFRRLVEPDPTLLNRTCRGVSRDARLGDRAPVRHVGQRPVRPVHEHVPRVDCRDLLHGLVHLHQVGADREVQRLVSSSQACAMPPRPAGAVSCDHARATRRRSGRSSTRRSRVAVLDVEQPRRHVDQRDVGAVAVHDQDAVEAVVDEAAALVEQATRRRRSSAASPSRGSRGGAACSRAPASGTAAPSPRPAR